MTIPQFTKYGKKSLKIPIKVQSFHSSEQITEFLNSSEDINFFCLFDFEILGSKQNGLDIIKSFSLYKNSIITTSHFDKVELQRMFQTRYWAFTEVFGHILKVEVLLKNTQITLP